MGVKDEEEVEMVNNLVMEEARPMAYTPEQARRELGGIGRYAFERLVEEGKIRTIRAGARRLLVPRSSIEEFLNGQHGA